MICTSEKARIAAGTAEALTDLLQALSMADDPDNEAWETTKAQIQLMSQTVVKQVKLMLEITS